MLLLGIRGDSGPAWALKGAEGTAGRGVVRSHPAALVTVPVSGAARLPDSCQLHRRPRA